MKLTESAATAILEVMKKKGLDHKKTFLEIGVFDSALGMSFTRDKNGRLVKFGNLSVVIAHNVDTTGVVIDFGEVNGRKGLIFLGEENVNHTNGKSS
jgi:hypothetical protein